MLTRTLLLSALLLVPLAAQPPAAVGLPPAPTGLTARDNPSDGGGSILVTWDRLEFEGLTGYTLYRQAERDTWEEVRPFGPRATSYIDDAVADGAEYRYRLAARTVDGATEGEPSDYVSSSPQWYDQNVTAALIGTVLLTGLIMWFTYHARRGRKHFIRRIAGLDAVEEALGRATEMGRLTLYIPGLSTVDDIATIAAINILAEVAKKTATYGTPLTVPTADPIVYTVARETVKESYTAVGRADTFDPGIVYFMTNEQFAYAAGVSGVMAREKPATNFFVGYFWAESLVLAETGSMTGAIQIAGTDALAQLPFFITACDYTLIGEELYASSAYLSQEPQLMGAIKGQDYSKFLIVALIVVGTILALTAGINITTWF